MIQSDFIEKVENYVECHCYDKKWFDYREKIGKPVDVRKIKSLEVIIKNCESNGRTEKSDQDIRKFVKSVQTLKMFEFGLWDKLEPCKEYGEIYFSEYLFELIKQKNITESEIIANARLNEDFFSELRKNLEYVPQEKIIWAIAIAMKLDSLETKNLLICGSYFVRVC